MEKVNALMVRNRLGEILDRLQATGEPILISRGRKVRAVLVSVEDFRRRFLDVQAEEERQLFLQRLDGLRESRVEASESLQVLRRLRGYDR